eukprot:gene6722-3393_t
MSAPLLVTPLKDLCVRVVASNFEACPTFGPLPDDYVKKVTDILPLDLPLELAGTIIHDEDYWRRRSCARWRSCESTAHGYSWKQLYFERNLQDALEQFDPEINSMDQLRRLMVFSRRYVQTVDSPSSISVKYNLKNVGMEYDRSLFGMKLGDCRSLAKSLETNETLTYLDLSNNGLDDDKVRMLASGLIENLSITHLNLSHNKIADRGMRALAKLLDSKSVISLLELQDNQIHTEGAKSLARALKVNQALISVNLRLNRMGDEGCKVVCDAIRNNQTIERFNMAANSAGEKETLGALSTLIRLNNSITELDVSCNTFGSVGCEQLRRALEQNSVLQRLEMRACGAEPDDEFAVAENLRVASAAP